LQTKTYLNHNNTTRSTRVFLSPGNLLHVPGWRLFTKQHKMTSWTTNTSGNDGSLCNFIFVLFFLRSSSNEFGNREYNSGSSPDKITHVFGPHLK